MDTKSAAPVAREAKSPAGPPTRPPAWWVYLLACSDGRTYAGIALDVQARFRVHQSGKGAKFTRSNRPVAILGMRSFAGRSQALKAEAMLKKLPLPQKLLWACACSVESADVRGHATLRSTVA